MNTGRTELTSNCKFVGGVFVSFDCLCSFDAGHFSPLVHLKKAPFIPINRKKGLFSDKLPSRRCSSTNGHKL